jgi:hypothetical protein
MPQEIKGTPIPSIQTNDKNQAVPKPSPADRDRNQAVPKGNKSNAWGVRVPDMSKVGPMISDKG